MFTFALLHVSVSKCLCALNLPRNHPANGPPPDEYTCQPVGIQVRAAVSSHALLYFCRIATAAFLGAAGDAVAQRATPSRIDANGEEATFEFDTKRGLSMVAFSAIYTGLFQTWWIGFLQVGTLKSQLYSRVCTKMTHASNISLVGTDYMGKILAN